MFDIFGTIKSLIKVERVRTDNNVFRLHYKFTVVLLVAFSIIVNSRQYFGDPIDCTSTDESIARVIDNYCWIHSYITLPIDFDQDEDYENKLPYYGVRRRTKRTFDKHQRYYQWVGFVLFIQAAFFFLPRMLWKYYWEGGRIKNLVTGLTTSFGDEAEYMPKIKLVLNYIKLNSNNNRIYAFSYFFCEFLNLVNVICQIMLTDWFLGYEFSSLGLKVISISEALPGSRTDILNLVFPKVAKCDFSVTGHNSEQQPLRSVCVLPVNTFNEKIYIALWYWFIFLAIISCLHLLYTMGLILVPRIRSIQLQRNFRLVNENPWDEPNPALEKKHEAQGVQMSDDEIIQTVTTKLSIGDWFLLYQLGKNMDALIFGKLLKEYAELLKGSRGKAYGAPPNNAVSHRNSSFEGGKRGSLVGIGIGSSAPLIH